MPVNRKYGWIKQKSDSREKVFRAPRNLAVLPSSVDLRGLCPPIYDQGDLGSCTANAIAAAIEFDQMVNHDTVFMPSRLFIYYNERELEGTTSEDSGAEIRDGIKVVNKQGACPESTWPYVARRFAQKPNLLAYDEALDCEAVQYEALTDLYSMKACLAGGLPFVFGIEVYESFESDAVAKTGVVPMPSLGEQSVGGHAICAVGYDDDKQVFWCRNSWGPDWGVRGYFTLPYAYVTDSSLSDDFWVIQKLQQKPFGARLADWWRGLFGPRN